MPVSEEMIIKEFGIPLGMLNCYKVVMDVHSHKCTRSHWCICGALVVSYIGCVLNPNKTALKNKDGVGAMA